MQPILMCTVPLAMVFSLNLSFPEKTTVSSTSLGRPPMKNAENRSTADHNDTVHTKLVGTYGLVTVLSVLEVPSGTHSGHCISYMPGVVGQLTAPYPQMSVLP